MTETIGKRLRLMRFWLMGTFVIIATAQVTVGFVIPGLNREPTYWVGLLISAVLFVIWYFAYRWWLYRNAE